MSRLGKMPITLAKGVEVVVDKGILKVKGPKGQLEYSLPEGISVKIEDRKVSVHLEEGKESVTHGLARAWIQNMVIGVEKNFTKHLTLVGVGFRAAQKGNKIELKIGFSHPIELDIPKGVTLTIDKGGVDIILTSCDKQIVGQFASDIRACRKPEPFKGKGIRYINEFVRKKAGKAAAKGK